MIMAGAYLHTVQIIKNGSPVGDNKANTNYITTTDTYYSFGGANDLWGNTLSLSDVNNNNFGIAIKAYCNYPGINTLTNYLYATGFNCNIPTNATIKGILAEIEAKYLIATGRTRVYIDHVRLKVYYAEAASSQIGSINGMARSLINSIDTLSIVNLKSFDGLV